MHILLIILLFIIIIVFCSNDDQKYEGQSFDDYIKEKRKKEKEEREKEERAFNAIKKRINNNEAFNNTWTPIYSNNSLKLIAGVRNNIIYRYEELFKEKWIEIGKIQGNKVYSTQAGTLLIGEIGTIQEDGKSLSCDCFIDRTEYISMSIRMCKESIEEETAKNNRTIGDDFYTKKIERMESMRSEFLVAQAHQSESSFASLFLKNDKEKDSGTRLVLFSQKRSYEQNASIRNLAAAFLVIQKTTGFDKCDVPLYHLWDF